MFSDITIKRTIPVTAVPEGNNVSQVIKVIMEYAPKEKMLVRLQSDPDIERPYSALLPRISFEQIGMSYDENRKLTSTGRNVLQNPDDPNSFLTQYNPVPYNLYFNAYIYAKNAEDAFKILEQIVPFFTPDYTPQIELIPEMNDIRNIPIVLKSIKLNDLYTDDFKHRRVLIWTLEFEIRAFLFGPVIPRPIIKFTTINSRIATANSAQTGDGTGIANNSVTNGPIVEIIKGQPGQLANGQPTANISLSVNAYTITVNSQYEFATELFDFTGNNTFDT